MAAAEPSGAPRRIVFLGPPNSGKGTQASQLAETLGVPAISTGEMLRAAVAEGSALGKRVEDVMARGELVDDAMMADVVRARLGQDDAGRGFILDGYPRTLPQVETLTGILAALDQQLDHVVLIDAPVEVLVARALARGRADDQEDIARERLRVYEAKTAPLVAHYDDAGLLRRVDGDQTIDEVRDALHRAVGVV
ncbi:MAG: adenylate kinase [Acidobacteriota bacterium]